MIIKEKITALILSVLILLTSISPITVFAERQDILAQYTGSTTASYGFKPDCTFTINKIVDGKFRGNFSATNLGQYSFDKAVNGSVIFIHIKDISWNTGKSNC